MWTHAEQHVRSLAVKLRLKLLYVLCMYYVCTMYVLCMHDLSALGASLSFLNPQ